MSIKSGSTSTTVCWLKACCDTRIRKTQRKLLLFLRHDLYIQYNTGISYWTFAVYTESRTHTDLCLGCVPPATSNTAADKDAMRNNHLKKKESSCPFWDFYFSQKWKTSCQTPWGSWWYWPGVPVGAGWGHGHPPARIQQGCCHLLHHLQ